MLTESAYKNNANNRILLGDVYNYENGYSRFYTDSCLDLNDLDAVEAVFETIYVHSNVYTVDDSGNLTPTPMSAATQILGRNSARM